MSGLEQMKNIYRHNIQFINFLGEMTQAKSKKFVVRSTLKFERLMEGLRICKSLQEKKLADPRFEIKQVSTIEELINLDQKLENEPF